MSELELICGDTRTIRVSFAQEGVPVLLAPGDRVSWTVRDRESMGSVSDEDAVIAMVASVSAPVSSVDFVLSAEVTRVPPGAYRWDAQLVRAGVVSSTRVGSVVFSQDVTKDVA